MKKAFILMIVLFVSIVVTSVRSENNWLIDYLDEDPYSAYSYAATIANMTANTTISGYSYRVAGSQGEYNVFWYIKNVVESFGLSVKVHEFDFINWDIPTEPYVEIILGNETLRTRVYPEHYTFGAQNINTSIVILPLPANFSEYALPDDIKTIWNETNISGKAVLIGWEVNFNYYWYKTFYQKVEDEKPVAIMYTWATEEFKGYPYFFSSLGGRKSLNRVNNITSFWIPKNIAQKIIDEYNENTTIPIHINVPIEESIGKVRNIIVNIKGRDPSKTLLITAHYDSVMTPALADNAAGVAGCLEIMWAFSKALEQGIYEPPINLTFVFFTAEEAGLVGSLKFYNDYYDYISDHVVGVLNLDTLGSMYLEVSLTRRQLRFLDEPHYIDDILKSTAREMGLPIRTFESYIHSDDSTFENTEMVANLVKYFWPMIKVNISEPLEIPAVMLGSSPYSPWGPENGYVGLIHTLYDNTTTTKTYDWVNPIRLEKQIKVAALAVLKILELYKQFIPAEKIKTENIIIATIISILILAISTEIIKKQKACS